MGSLLSTFGIDWHLLIANAVNFIVLVALLTWLLYKPVMKMVAQRERTIAKGVEDAEEAARKLQEADGTAAERVDKAESEAAGIVDSARKAANEAKSTLLKEVKNAQRPWSVTLNHVRRSLRSKALRESEKEIARLAMLAAAKVIKEKA